MAFNGPDRLQAAIRDLRTPSHRTTRMGKVREIGEDYEDPESARVELEEEESAKAKARRKAKSKRQGMPVGSDSYTPRFHVKIPKSHTADLKLGDRVAVHTRIEKAQ